MAPAETPTGFLRIAHRDQGAAVDPFIGLSRFTLFAVLRRYDEEPELENLDRGAWNQLCADLLDHVGSLLP
jgi:hypothetical protein